MDNLFPKVVGLYLVRTKIPGGKPNDRPNEQSLINLRLAQ